MRFCRLVGAVLAVLAGSAWMASAQSAAPADLESQQGVPSPSPPPPSTDRSLAVVRSPDGRLQVTAVEAPGGVTVDGALDDEVWGRALPVSGFVQSEPDEGDPATEDTEVRVAYDRTTLYIAAYCYDREPDAAIVNDIREDFQSGDQDTFEVILDTFADRRNGFLFMTNPAGARSDQQVANEGREINTSWDAVWSVRTRVVDNGWIVEMAIPFKSLRFEGSLEQLWGINFSRRIRRRNEVTYWSPVARQFKLTRVSLAGDLAGLPATSRGRNLQVKPYAAARSVRETGAPSFDTEGDLGLDVKYGVTPSLTLDVTVNPDFAQAEADEQRVNLTQFSLFFPEKRDFFLENSGIFYVGDAARANRTTTTPTPDEDLLLFFSRRIGLTPEGIPIPITVGGRLTGQVGGFGLGLLTVQTRGTETTPNNNWSVVRTRRNVFSTSDIGAIFMTRQSTDSASDYNRVYGLDTNVRLARNLDWNSYFIKTATPGFTDGQFAFRSTYNYEGNSFHSKGGVMSIGENFNDELGFFRRVDVRKWIFDTGIRPRPVALAKRGVRELHPHVTWNYFTNQAGRMVAKRLHTGFSVFLNDGTWGELSYNPRFELLTSPFTIHSGSPPIPPGDYGWDEWGIRFVFDPSGVISANTTTTFGELWTGTQKSFRGAIAIKPSYRFRAEVGLQYTDAELDLPDIEFITAVWTLRTNYSFSTNMFFDTLFQYDRDRERLNANVRFNLIHRPLSDLFVVYNEQRFVTDELINPGRGVIVKFTQMMAF